MQPAIAVYAGVAWLVLFGLDRLWPVWPVHAVACGLGVVVAALALLAGLAQRRR